MPKLRVHALSISVDGYAAGPEQSLDNPLGVGGEDLHRWMFATASWRRGEGEADAPDTADDPYVRAGEENIGATIMGRNMFGPIRGDWGGSDWSGWWGEDPPYHHPVFVLTHYAHEPIPMKGGTTFYFVTDGIEAALARALDAAGGRDVRLGGGAATVREYLRAGLVDEMHVVVSPILLGGGERLFDGTTGGLSVVEMAGTPAPATHIRLQKTV